METTYLGKSEEERERERIRYFTRHTKIYTKILFSKRVTRKHENEAVRGKRFGEGEGGGKKKKGKAYYLATTCN